ncbi:copper resistance protein B [Microbulbifer thermotolerans]|uniref:copper resistance protein B n=1 Tax=Microbulbifer thermotolerans TaxID=252514 RepID=UPI002248A34A|nr:copper resistance protein B [Microbulbifer thermotolerans]MCX2831633.1 copper resistance protein B [Microbulbifer thermotolerans]
MKKRLISNAVLAALSSTAAAEPACQSALTPDHVMDHNTLLTTVSVDRLEARGDQGSALRGDIRFGGDRDKLWLKGDLNREENSTENAELQLLYSRAVAPYWDLQIGMRHDFRLGNGPSENWGVIGFQGLAPYFFEVESALFASDGGDIGMRIGAEYELLFTQRLILSPEIELDFYGQNDRDNETAAGLSEMEAGLRLRYEFTRQFAPYIGIHHERKFGRAADFAREDGRESRETTWVMGLSVWF